MFRDHFSDVASRYADFRPRYPDALFDYLAALVPADTVVWDCAAGNGQASLDLAQRFHRVIATDASQEQIAAAPAHARVEFRVAPAEASGLADRAAGLVTVAQALHWFDLNRFYAEARRVLQPDGVLAVWAYGINHIDEPSIDEAALDYYHRVVGDYWPPERQLVEDGYRTISFPFAGVQPPEFQMEVAWTLAQLLGYFSTWSATNRYRKATGRNPLEPLGDSLARLWGDPETPRRITWPLAVRVGRNSD